MSRERTKDETDEEYAASSVDAGVYTGTGDMAEEPVTFSDTAEERVLPHDAPTDVVDVVVPKAKATVTSLEVQRPGVVVSGKSLDDVLLKQCIYKNKFSRKSLSVHHLQRRLGELGFRDAMSDVDGWYGDLTRHAVQEFQRANKLDVTLDMNQETLVSIFKGDPHVILIY